MVGLVAVLPSTSMECISHGNVVDLACMGGYRHLPRVLVPGRVCPRLSLLVVTGCNSMISAEHDMASDRSLRPHCSAPMWYGTPFIIFELLVLGPWCLAMTWYETCFVKVLLWWVGLRWRKLC